MQIQSNRYVTPALMAILLISAGCGDGDSNNGGAKGTGGGNGNTGGIGKPEDLPLGDQPAAIGHARWYDSNRKGFLPVLGFDYRWKDAPPKVGDLKLAYTIVNSDRRLARIPKRYRSIPQTIDAAGLAQSGTLYSGRIDSGSFLIAIELHLELNGKAISNVLHIPIPNGTYSELSTVGRLPAGAVTMGSARKKRRSTGKEGQKLWVLKRANFNRLANEITVSCGPRPRVQLPRLPQATTFTLVCRYKRVGGGMGVQRAAVMRHTLFGGFGRSIKSGRIPDLDPASPVEFALTAKLPDGTIQELADRMRFLPKTNRVVK